MVCEADKFQVTHFTTKFSKSSISFSKMKMNENFTLTNEHRMIPSIKKNSIFI